MNGHFQQLCLFTRGYLVGGIPMPVNVIPMTDLRIAPTDPPQRFCEARHQWPPSLCHPLDRWDSIGDVNVKRMDYPMVSYGKQTNNYGKWLCFIGKSKNLMTVFHIQRQFPQLCCKLPNGVCDPMTFPMFANTNDDLECMLNMLVTCRAGKLPLN